MCVTRCTIDEDEIVTGRSCSELLVDSVKLPSAPLVVSPISWTRIETCDNGESLSASIVNPVTLPVGGVGAGG